MELKVIEDIVTFSQEQQELFLEHSKFCEPQKYEAMGFELDAELLQSMIDSGHFLFLAAYEEELVGYIGVFVTPCILNKGEQNMTVQFLYVKEPYRRSSKASEMVDSLTELCKELEVSWILMSLPNKDYSDQFADGLGFSKASAIYGKGVN